MASFAYQVEEKKKRGRPAKRIDKRVRSYKDIVAALPPEVGSKLVFSREVFVKSYDLTKWLRVYGLGVLNPQEFLLLHFIFSRTLHYGKLAEMITKDHFLRGVWSGDEVVCMPIRTNPNTLYKTIRSLEEKGLITVTPIHLQGRDLPTLYEIAIDFILGLRPSEEYMSKLRQPKVKKTADVVDFEAFRAAKMGLIGGTNSYHLDDKQVVPIRTTNISNIKTEDNKVLVASASPSNEVALRVRRKPRASSGFEIDCNASARDVINLTIERSTAKREAKVVRAAQGSAVALADLNATWKKAMIAEFGTCTVAGLTVKEFGMFKRIVKTHEIACTWLEFFTWVIGNWTRINRESREFNEYRKKKSGEWSMKQEDMVFLGSEVPDLFMTIKNFGKLIKRYSQHSLGVVVAGKREDTEEVKQLRQELASARKEASTSQHLLRKAMTAREEKPVARVAPKVKARIVNPDVDTFFDEPTETLPRWK